MKYNIPVNSKTRYRIILTILNFNLKLSKLEMTILVTLLENGFNVINIDARETLIKTLNKSQYIINNYFGSLKRKGILISNKLDRSLYIDHNIINLCNKDSINFNFINNIEI